MVPVRRLLGVSLVVACLVAACGSNATGPTPSSVVLAATGRPVDPSIGSCMAAVSSLAAFTERLGKDLAAVRTPLKTTPFDSAATAAASFHVSATITAYKSGEIEAVLQGCPATAVLAPRVKKLIDTADTALEQARVASINNPATQKAAATSLVNLLPEVQKLATRNNEIVAALDLTSGVAAGSSASPGAAADWTTAANAYLEDTYATYGAARSAAQELAGLDPTASGVTPDELAARQVAAATAWTTAGQALTRHLATMDANVARPCYTDAYSADRKLAAQWQKLLGAGTVPAVDTELGRTVILQANQAMTQTTAFLTGMGAYFAGCR